MSLLETARKVINSEILENNKLMEMTRPSYNGELNKLLVTDEMGMSMLSLLYSNSEFQIHGFCTGFDVEKKYKPLPVHLVYFISGTKTNFEFIAKEFETGRKEQYLSCHIFSYTNIDDQTISFIKGQKGLKIKLKTLKEIPFSFFIEAEDIFTLSPEFNISSIFNDFSNKVIEGISTGIFDMLHLMKDVPSVRYLKGSSVAESVAISLNQKLQSLLRKSPQFNYKDNTKKNSQIIILARPFDQRAVFLHELTLEAMTHDLLDVKKHLYYFKTNEQKAEAIPLQLDHTQPLWVSFRDEHIADVSSKVVSKLKDLNSENRLKIPEGQITASQLQEIVQKYPAYQKELKLYQRYTLLAEKTMAEFNSRRLEDFIKAEQDYATGLDTQGNRIPESAPLPLTLLSGEYSKYDKFRLIMLFGLRQESRISKQLIDKLFSFGQIENMKPYLSNLSKLGISISEDDTNRQEQLPRCSPNPSLTGGYDLSRYIPAMWDVLNKLVNQDTSPGNFPFVGEASYIAKNTDDGKQAFAFGKYSKQKTDTNKIKPTFYVFVVGGITLSEARILRCAQQHHPDSHIILGGTQLFTPKEFISEIEKLI